MGEHLHFNIIDSS